MIPKTHNSECSGNTGVMRCHALYPWYWWYAEQRYTTVILVYVRMCALISDVVSLVWCGVVCTCEYAHRMWARLCWKQGMFEVGAAMVSQAPSLPGVEEVVV